MIEDSLLRAAIECVRAARRAARTALGRPLRIGIEIRWRLGDEIMAVPIYDGIKQKYPTCHLTVWCNHPDVLIDNPHVDRVLGPQYGPRVFDVDRYILLRGAPRHRFRIDHYAARAGVPTPQRDPQLYYNDWSSDRLAGAGIAGKSFVAVSTGATWETKRWPIDHWKALCESLTADGHTIVQLGNNDERVPGAHDLVGQTTVCEAACILHHARLLISCDSGLMHLALAAGTPVLALFGPTDPAMLVGAGAPLTVLANGRPCQGCWNHSGGPMIEGVCPLCVARCMETIAPETVRARVRQLLDS